MKHRAVLALAIVLLTISLGTPAHAAIVGADVHGFFSGSAEVWAGKFPVELHLNYRTTEPTQGSAPGFVHIKRVIFDARDPAGHTSSGITIAYRTGGVFQPIPITDFGEVDDYDTDVFRTMQVTAPTGAKGGTWRIRARLQSWYWQQGSSAVPGTGDITIRVTEDWYNIVVHPAPTTATTTSATAPSTTGDGSSTHSATNAASPSANAVAPSETTTDPASPAGSPTAGPTPAALRATAAVPVVRTTSWPWPLMLLIGALAAACGAGGVFGFAALRRRFTPQPPA